jgi:hypothetical protein
MARFEKGKAPGRPKGAKNLKTKEKEAALTGALILASSTGRAAAKIRRDLSKPVLDKTGIEMAPPGIDAKNLFLAVMREAWAEKAAKGERAGILEDEADRLQAEALALPAEENEKPADHKVRIAVQLEAVTKLREQVREIRSESRTALALAMDAATRVAPYEHPKLQNQIGNVDTTINVILAKF